MMRITKAEKDDLPAILELQRLAYRSEARLLGNFNIPPLLQTLEDMREEYRCGVFLKATDEDGRIVGSVRGFAREGTLFVGKLMVRPDRQRQGLGSRLLLELEKTCPSAQAGAVHQRPQCGEYSPLRAQRLRALQGKSRFSRFDVRLSGKTAFRLKKNFFFSRPLPFKQSFWGRHPQ